MKKVIALLIGTILSLHLKAMDQSAIQASSDRSFNIERFLKDLDCPQERFEDPFQGPPPPRPTEECLKIIAEKLPQELANQSQQVKDGVIEYAQRERYLDLKTTLITQAVLAGGNTNKYENGISRNPTLEVLIQWDFYEYIYWKGQEKWEECYNVEAYLKKNTQFVQFLLEHGAQVNCYTSLNSPPDDELVPIIFAAQSVPLITLMLEHGADLILTSREKVSKDIFQFMINSHNFDLKLLEIYLKKSGRASANALTPFADNYFWNFGPLINKREFENFSNYLKCLLDHGSRLDISHKGKPLIQCILDTISENFRSTIKHFIKEPTENALLFLFTIKCKPSPKFFFKFLQLLFSCYHKRVMTDHSCYLSKIPNDIKQMIIPFLVFAEWNSTIGIVQPNH